VSPVLYFAPRSRPAASASLVAATVMLAPASLLAAEVNPDPALAFTWLLPIFYHAVVVVYTCCDKLTCFAPCALVGRPYSNRVSRIHLLLSFCHFLSDIVTRSHCFMSCSRYMPGGIVRIKGERCSSYTVCVATISGCCVDSDIMSLHDSSYTDLNRTLAGNPETSLYDLLPLA